MSPPVYEWREPLLRIENVSLSLGGKPVLKNLDATIRDIHRPGMQQGQVVAILGPSGVGKTRLFRLLAGLDTPDSGRILVGAQQRPVVRGMVGVVAQDYPLFRHRTVLGNLIVAAREQGLAPAAARAAAVALLARFGLAEQGARYPDQLSGGQRQRVSIAQQLLCSDDLLLMDEPFSGLDLVALKNVSDLIGEIAATGEAKTFIIVTHDVAAALEVADTIWLLGRDRDPSGAPPGRRPHPEDLRPDRTRPGVARRDHGRSGLPRSSARDPHGLHRALTRFPRKNPEGEPPRGAGC